MKKIKQESKKITGLLKEQANGMFTYINSESRIPDIEKDSDDYNRFISLGCVVLGQDNKKAMAQLKEQENG